MLTVDNFALRVIGAFFEPFFRLSLEGRSVSDLVSGLGSKEKKVSAASAQRPKERKRDGNLD